MYLLFSSLDNDFFSALFRLPRQSLLHLLEMEKTSELYLIRLLVLAKSRSNRFIDWSRKTAISQNFVTNHHRCMLHLRISAISQNFVTNHPLHFLKEWIQAQRHKESRFSKNIRTFKRSQVSKQFPILSSLLAKLAYIIFERCKYTRKRLWNW